MPVHNQQTEGMGFDFWWHSSSATGNRGKRRFTITKAIKLLETTTPYTCRILLQTTLSSFHWIGWGDEGSRPMHAFGSLLPLASRDGESMRCPASYWWKRLPWSRGPPSTGNGLVDAVDAFEASISSEGWEQGSLLHSSDSIPLTARSRSKPGAFFSSKPVVPKGNDLLFAVKPAARLVV